MGGRCGQSGLADTGPEAAARVPGPQPGGARKGPEPQRPGWAGHGGTRRPRAAAAPGPPLPARFRWRVSPGTPAMMQRGANPARSHLSPSASKKVVANYARAAPTSLKPPALRAASPPASPLLPEWGRGGDGAGRGRGGGVVDGLRPLRAAPAAAPSAGRAPPAFPPVRFPAGPRPLPAPPAAVTCWLSAAAPAPGCGSGKAGGGARPFWGCGLGEGGPLSCRPPAGPAGTLGSGVDPSEDKVGGRSAARRHQWHCPGPGCEPRAFRGERGPWSDTHLQGGLRAPPSVPSPTGSACTETPPSRPRTTVWWPRGQRWPGWQGSHLRLIPGGEGLWKVGAPDSTLGRRPLPLTGVEPLAPRLG